VKEVSNQSTGIHRRTKAKINKTNQLTRDKKFVDYSHARQSCCS
jgi:hypothetical protein